MTLIAGIFSRHARPLVGAECASLRQAISRNPADRVEIFSDRRSYFAKVDIGAFHEPGSFTDADGALSLLAGEPLLGNRDCTTNSNRLADLTTIHEQVLKHNWSSLRDADGTFCLVHYHPQTGMLALVADKLGIRPLYFYLGEDMIVFASALRILEELSFVPKKMDLRGVTEVVGLGAPLSDRTPYSGIFLLKPAEIVQITNEVTRSCYWRWDEIKTAADSESIRLTAVRDRFQSAITRRQKDDRATTAYLSGGLDSRSIVASLYQDDVRVRTVNFARPGTQDYYFGNNFAEKIGSIHQSIPKEKGDSVPDYSWLMARAQAGFDRSQGPLERPRLVWSGEGGSMLLGHIHLSESLIELMRANKIDRAIEEFLEQEQIDIPIKLFRPRIRERVRDVIREGIREELDQLHAADAGRNLYLFLVHNDQRRKLMAHFENLDLHRLEFHLPFFDAAFLESVVATPLDWCLRHKFYNKWLSLFPAAVTGVPWQVYPGHEPCPLPIEKELGYQWDEEFQATERVAQKRALLMRASKLLSASDFPHEILSRRNLRLAAWTHRAGWRDYEYVIGAAQTYYEYWKNCNATPTLPKDSAPR
jgi:asparagine synthase (glutamine-hydrolysing)